MPEEQPHTSDRDTDAVDFWKSWDAQKDTMTAEIRQQAEQLAQMRRLFGRTGQTPNAAGR